MHGKTSNALVCAIVTVTARSWIWSRQVREHGDVELLHFLSGYPRAHASGDGMGKRGGKEDQRRG